MAALGFSWDSFYFRLFCRKKEAERKLEMNFTKRALDVLPVPEQQAAVVRDDSTRGLGLRIEPTGKRTFFWSRKSHGRAVWRTIGEYPFVSLDEAREKANGFNIEREKWKAGENPTPRSDRTLGEIITQYIERHIRATAAHPERAVKEIQSQTHRCLKNLSERKVASIRRAEILALRETTYKKSGPSAANRLVQNLRAALNWAIEAELWTGVNPAEGIPMYREKKRRRFLYKHELDALRDALNQTPNRDLADFVRLALMTGARKSDIYSMKWTDLALDRGTWLVPEPKNREPYPIALTRHAVEILRARQNGSVWVFPSSPENPSRTGHILDMKRSWAQLLRRAGIEDLRQHDLRRTLGSWQAAGGASLLIIGKSLGHKTAAATQVYAQLDLSAVRESVERATTAMFADTPKLLSAAKGARRE